MISVTGITGKYIVQPALLEKHARTLEWLSASVLWKSEMVFFQKLLDERSQSLRELEQKKKIDHFQNLIIYYRGEVIDNLRSQLRQHESKLATLLQSEHETDTQYYREHDHIMEAANDFSVGFARFRSELLNFLENGQKKNKA